MNRKLTLAEKNVEALSLIIFLCRISLLLSWKTFHHVLSHRGLSILNSGNVPQHRRMFSRLIQPYDFDLQIVPGRQHILAYLISRN